ncbi:MAG: (d)CMP kinase [Xanthomonadales bacterium]|nr:(d)CMP kinase [Xanthomonadales bacterium]NIX12372.1 (d)CMP kinase [Xanthomonadales bacterium]
MERVPVITIDGPLGSGKGTIANALASQLGWHLLDSGALYRLVAIAALDAGLGPGDEEALAELAARLDVQFADSGDDQETKLNGARVGARLRSQEVSAMASRVAALAGVRAAIVKRQQDFRRPPGLVADGRDMGTVIFPDAPLKIFLTASVEVRAQRRYKQLKEKGESVNLSRLFRDIEERDERDRTRRIAPLRPAADAVIIDSSELSIKEVLAKIKHLLEEKDISI